MEGELFGMEDCPSRAIAGKGWGETLSNPSGFRGQGAPKDRGLCHRREAKEDEESMG